MAERKRIGVPISGLDTSTPDHSVVDGKCETLHNLRYTGEAWRNMKEFEQHPNPASTEELGNATEFHIVYKHPADVDNAYIIQTTSEDGISIFRAEYSSDESTWKCSLIAILGNSEEHYEYRHFGKILIVGYPTAKKFAYFLLWKNHTYREITTVDKQIEMSVELGEPKVSKAWSNSSGKDQEYIYSNMNYNEVTISSIEDGYFRGEIAIIATLELESGDEIYRSAPVIVNTAQVDIISYSDWLSWAKTQNEGYGYPPIQIFADKATEGVTITYVADGLESFSGSNDIKTFGFPCARLYQPTVHINLKREAIEQIMENTPLKLKVWATKVQPLFDILRLKQAAESIRTTEYEIQNPAGYLREIYPNKLYEWFADNDIFNQQFYLLKSFDVPSFDNDEWIKELKLLGSDLEKIIHQPLYLDTISYTDLYSNKAVEINNRLHLIAPYNKLNNINDINLEKGEDYEFISLLSKDSTLAKVDEQYANEQGFFLTAPARISKLTFYKNTGLNRVTPYSFTMKEAKSLVLSTYLNRVNADMEGVNDEVGSKPYRDIEISRDGVRELSQNARTLSFNNEELDSNRIQVSALNSNLSFEYKTSYRVGTQYNHIITINSAAIEMSDSKFGEFPVYVFTTEGIFAMQSGKETLYSAVIPINYDVIINPNTLAINGAVLYFTDKGLHALTNQGAKLLSAPIHTAENRIPQWMYTTQMVYLPEWNEVMCVDLESKKAYVFSLDSNVWSTRDIPEGYILNNDELVSTNEKIYNLRYEQETIANGQASTAQRNTIRATATTATSQKTLHKWSSKWGVLDDSKDGVSRGYIEYNNRYLYQSDNSDYFKDQELYYETNPNPIHDSISDLRIVSEESPFEGAIAENIVLLIVKESNGQIVAKSTFCRPEGVYDDGTRYDYNFDFKSGDNTDLSIPTVYILKDRNKVSISNVSYYEWGAADASGDPDNPLDPNNPFGQSAIEYVLKDWYSSFPNGYIPQEKQDIYYSGDYNNLYYGFDEPLPASNEQPVPKLYSLNGTSLQEFQSKILGSPIDVITYTKEDITPPSISIFPSSSSLPSSGGTVGIKLTTNASWSASCEIEDVVITPASGEGDATISITVPETTVTRTIDILFTASLNGYTEDTSLQITQSPNSSGEDDDNNGDNDDDTTYAPTSFALTTRPIKLGSMELKRAETIIVRFECPTEQTLNVEVEGSIDTQNWKTLRKLEGVQTNKDIVIRRTPCSVKYLRFKIDGNVTDDIRILAFEVEYYNRMRHRMR